MSVTSCVVVQNPVDANELFAAALAVVRLPVTGKGWRRVDLGDVCILRTEHRQGAAAYVSLQYSPGGGLLPVDEDEPEPSGYAIVAFRTGGERSAESRRLHEGLVAALGQWLTARQLEWSRQYVEDEEENIWVAGYMRTRPHTCA
jgi:hypothetical protein